MTNSFKKNDSAWARFLTPPMKMFVALLCCLSLTSCIGAVVGATVDTAIEVVKVPFKVTGAAVDLIIPGGDDDD